MKPEDFDQLKGTPRRDAWLAMTDAEKEAWKEFRRIMEPAPPAPSLQPGHFASQFVNPWEVSAIRAAAGLSAVVGAITGMVSMFGDAAAARTSGVVVLVWMACTCVPLLIFASIVRYLAFTAWCSERTYELLSQRLTANR